MERDTLVGLLEHDPRYDYILGKCGAVVVVDLHIGDDRDHPITKFTPGAIARHTWPEVRAQATHGRDVDHVTRITGYFSRTSGWNRGKAQELKDRHRTTVEEG